MRAKPKTARLSPDERDSNKKTDPAANPNGVTPQAQARAIASRAALAARECFKRIVDVGRTELNDSERTLTAVEMIELRRCLVDYVSALRGVGTPPERALAVVKNMVTASLRQWEEAARPMSALVIDLVVATYYPVAPSK